MPKAKTAYTQTEPVATAFADVPKPDTEFADTAKPDTGYVVTPGQPVAITYNDSDYSYGDATMHYIGYDPDDILSQKPHTSSATIPKNSTEFATISKEQTGYN